MRRTTSPHSVQQFSSLRTEILLHNIRRNKFIPHRKHIVSFTKARRLTTHSEVMAVYCEDLWRSIFVMLNRTVTLCSGVFSAKQSYPLGATWHVCWHSQGAYKYPAAVQISEGTQRCNSNVIHWIKLTLLWRNFRTYKYISNQTVELTSRNVMKRAIKWRSYFPVWH